MKLFKSLLICLMGLFTAVSCSEDSKKDEPADPAVQLATDRESIDADHLSKKEVITITAPASWNAIVSMNDQKEELWCSVTKSKNELTIRLKENYVKAARKASIKVTCGKEEKEIQVTQAAALKERDPFYVDFGNQSWDNSWTFFNFMHNNTKFDPINYMDGITGKYMGYSNGGSMTIGLKLTPEFLAEFGGKSLNRFELRANGPLDVTFALLKKKAVIKNNGEYADYINEVYTTEELWKSAKINHPADTDWVIADASTGQDINVPLNAADGELFIVAYLENVSSNEFIFVQQVLNEAIPTYISLTGTTGQDLYRFVGGTCMLNFYIQ